MILATDEDTKVKDAVTLRFKELCEERNISPNALAVRSGVTPSTVYSMLDSSQQSVTVPTVKKLCDGLGITLVDFFNASIFTTIDQGIPIKTHWCRFIYWRCNRRCTKPLIIFTLEL